MRSESDKGGGFELRAIKGPWSHESADGSEYYGRNCESHDRPTVGWR